jgi:hypothetical protein
MSGIYCCLVQVHPPHRLTCRTHFHTTQTHRVISHPTIERKKLICRNDLTVPAHPYGHPEVRTEAHGRPHLEICYISETSPDALNPLD